MSGILNIESGNEHDLLAAVATVGPVAAAVDASSNAFRVGMYVYIIIVYTEALKLLLAGIVWIGTAY